MMKHYMLTILLIPFFGLLGFAQESTPAIIDCKIGNLPIIVFKEDKYKLSKNAKLMLDSIAYKMIVNPNCNVRLIGYGFWNASEECKAQLCWMQINTVRNYLIIQQGIPENRLIFEYGSEGERNTVSLEGTIDDGPQILVAPHPGVKKFNKRSCENLHRH